DAALVALAFATPLLPVFPRALGDHSGAAPLVLIGVAVTGAALARRLARGEPSPLPRSFWKWPIAFLAAAAVSAFSSAVRGETLYLLLRGGVRPLNVNELGMQAADRDRSALGVFLVLALLALALDGFTRLARAGGQALLLRAVAAGAFLALSAAAFEREGSVLLTTPGWASIGRRSGTFSDPNALGVAIGLLVPLLVAVLVSERSFAMRALSLGGLVVACVALERSGSRTGLLLLLVASLLGGLWMLLRRPRTRLWVAGGFVVALLVLGLAARRAPRGGSTSVGGLVTRIGAALSAASFEDFATHRPLFWRTAFEMMADEPLSGCGLGGFPYEFPPFYTSHHSHIMVTDSATNTLLDVGAECGVLALLLALAAVVPLLVRALDALFGAPAHHPLEDRPAARAAAAALIGFAVASLTGSHIRFPDVAILVALCAALLPLPDLEERISGFAPPKRVVALLMASSMAASLFVLIGTRTPSAAFRTGPWVGDYGAEFHENIPVRRWLGPRAFRRIRPGETSLSLTLRNARPDERPVLVTSDLDGARVQSVSVPPGEARTLVLVDIPAGAGAVRLRFDPTFVPWRLTGREDFRTLSVLLEADATEATAATATTAATAGP
ncbi:MAG: O-antigen ligase family protein, partial [Thermoanaerobaculia bacterium]